MPQNIGIGIPRKEPETELITTSGIVPPETGRKMRAAPEHNILHCQRRDDRMHVETGDHIAVRQAEQRRQQEDRWYQDVARGVQREDGCRETDQRSHG